MATQNYQAPGWVAQGANSEVGSGPSRSTNGPASYNYLAWTASPEDVQGTTALVTATTYLTRVITPASGVSTKVDVNVVAAGSPTAAYIGIYSAAGALLATTAESHTLWVNGKVTLSWVAPVILTGGTNYYVALNVTATSPTVSGIALSTVQNFGLTASTMSFGTAAANTVPFPAANVMASNTANNTLAVPWFGIY